MWRLLPLLCGLLLAACDQPGDREPPPAEDFRNYSEKGDLSSLKKRGYLRLIAPRFDSDPALPREGLPMDAFRKEAEAFARSENLTPVWVYVDGFSQLIDHLEDGKGDLVVANLTQTQSREQRVDFSVPVAMVDEVLVLPAGSGVSRLDGAQLAIAAPGGTSYIESARELAEQHEGITVQPLDGGISDQDLVDGVAEGRFQAAILDSNMADVLLRGMPGVKRGPVVTKNRAIGWAARPDNNELRRRLNEYLISHRVMASRSDAVKRDWHEIKQSGELRMITSNNPASYFLWRGDLMGFDYELIKHFADRHGLRVSVVVRDSPSAMFDALESGRGDVIAASLTTTQARRDRGLVFSRRYLEVTEQLVGGKRAGELEAVKDLEGRTVAVNPESSFHGTLKSLREQGIDVEIREVPHRSTEQLIDAVADGRYEFTVADSHLAALESTWRDDIKVLLDISDQRDVAWVLRPDQPILKQQLDNYISKEYRGLFYNIVFNRYFKEPKTIEKHREHRVEPGKDISPFDHLVKQYAAEYGYDWRMITAQMFQESRFDPKAESFAGAKGLMQLLPRTAKELGYDKLHKPEQSIAAGVTYLDWLWDRFPGDLPLEERIYFTLASYNAGYNHVRDARRLARQQGLDPDRWFGNVEKAMLLLSKPEYYRNARFGYVRGSEPVQYVREIRNRYIGYLEVTERGE